VFGSQGMASLLAGTAMETIGWQALNLASAPLLAVVLYLLWRRSRPNASEISA
jgi:hypothetical protein